MKQANNQKTLISLRQLTRLTGLITILLFFSFSMMAQKDSTPKKATTDTTVKSEAPAVEAPEMISPALQLVCVQKADNTIGLKATMKVKYKGTSVKLPFLKVKFMLKNGADEKELGFAITNGEGKALFNFNADSLKPDAEGKLHIKAVFAGNKAMDPAEEEVSFKRARLEITPVKEDSVLSVKLKLIDLGTGVATPVKEVTLGVYVSRSFNPLKLGEGATDANGEATVEIPAHLPGDAQGNITLMGRLDENETYGNLEASAVQQWGVPVSDKIAEQPRELWSPHPPIWMLVTFIILMGAVWGHYIVIVVQLFRLRKEEPQSNTVSV